MPGLTKRTTIVAALTLLLSALGAVTSTTPAAGGPAPMGSVVAINLPPGYRPPAQPSPRVSPAYQGTGIESVIGADGRDQVLDTTVYPARAIGQLEIDQNGGGGTCTGWLIDPNTILTSGHCAFDPSPTGDDIIESAVFAPGRNGPSMIPAGGAEPMGAGDPFGTCEVDAAFSPVEWRVDGSEYADWALMQLDCTVGDTVGWLGYFSIGGRQQSLNQRPARVQGYPGDMPFGTQWAMTGQIDASQARMLFYAIDTFGGNSGSPVFQPHRVACGGPCGMAVHSYGVHGDPRAPHARFNHGPRITNARFDLITDLADDNADPCRLGSSGEFC